MPKRTTPRRHSQTSRFALSRQWLRGPRVRRRNCISSLLSPRQMTARGGRHVVGAAAGVGRDRAGHRKKRLAGGRVGGCGGGGHDSFVRSRTRHRLMRRWVQKSWAVEEQASLPVGCCCCCWGCRTCCHQERRDGCGRRGMEAQRGSGQRGRQPRRTGPCGRDSGRTGPRVVGMWLGGNCCVPMQRLRRLLGRLSCDGRGCSWPCSG